MPRGESTSEGRGGGVGGSNRSGGGGAGNSGGNRSTTGSPRSLGETPSERSVRERQLSHDRIGQAAMALIGIMGLPMAGVMEPVLSRVAPFANSVLESIFGPGTAPPRAPPSFGRSGDGRQEPLSGSLSRTGPSNSVASLIHTIAPPSTFIGSSSPQIDVGKSQAKKERRKSIEGLGGIRGSTLVTSPLGLLTPANTTKKTLLGI